MSLRAGLAQERLASLKVGVELFHDRGRVLDQHIEVAHGPEQPREPAELALEVVDAAARSQQRP